MDCALELKVGDITCDPDGNRFRITKADVNGYKIDVAYVPEGGGEEISETLTVNGFVEIVWWEGKDAEAVPTPEEIAIQQTIDRILDGPPSDASARDLATAYEALETKGRI